jgi:hypothetical protein
MIDPFLPPHRLRGNPALQRLAIQPDAAHAGLSALLQQLQPEVAQPRRQQIGQSLHTTLGSAIEQGVATPQVGPQRMVDTTAIAQAHHMVLTGATAIGVVVPLREKGTEQAMLHVKQGHVLMQGHLQLVRIHRPGQIEQLTQVRS